MAPPKKKFQRGAGQPAKKRKRIVFERDELDDSDGSDSSDCGDDSLPAAQEGDPALRSRRGSDGAGNSGAPKQPRREGGTSAARVLRSLRGAGAKSTPQRGEAPDNGTPSPREAVSILRSLRHAGTPRSDAGRASPPEGPTFERDELDSTDEEVNSDEEAETDIPKPFVEDEHEGVEYEMFLKSILGEADSAAGEDNQIPEEFHNELNLLLDGEDDFDFDYLRESALVPEDPFEFRNDRAVHVSHKEIIQLHNADPALRPRTRKLVTRDRRADGRSPARPGPKPVTPPIAAPTVPQYGFVSAPPMPPIPPPPQLPLPPLPPVLPVGEAPVPQAPPSIPTSLPGQTAVAMVPPMPGLSVPRPVMKIATGPGPRPQPVNPVQNLPLGHIIPPFCFARIREQYLIHVHLLAAVHADAARIAASPPAEKKLPERDIETACRVLEKTSGLANDLVRKRETAVAYWNMVAPYRAFQAQAAVDCSMYSGQTPAVSSNAPNNSLFDSPVVKCLPAFLTACREMKAEDKPLSVVQRILGAHLHPYIEKSLAPVPKRVLLSSELRLGEQPWTAPDDQLLAMTLAKHTREFGEKSKDLLPHRTTEDCDGRVKYLSSRRCGDNAVKRHVNFNATALNRDELRSIQHYLLMFGKDAEKKVEVWKAIQRDFMPRRDWSYMQKLWEVRENRRRYKANYRKKVASKKSAVSEEVSENP